MRIISGIYKSRVLISPETPNVRPTSDRAKETIFNILGNIIDFENTFCMDLFCGTGALGLECISRGAAKCLFADTDTRSVMNNIKLLKEEEKCEVFRTDAVSFLSKNKSIKADLVFCDPPYDFQDYNKIIEYGIAMETLFILEHSGKYAAEKDFEKYIYKKSKTGAVNFTIFDFNTKP
jgi:16S rRNA (guanine(966)-N(2))-methyltransferase RsmD